MITERETTRYMVAPKKFIENSFSTAYDSASDAPIITKPDLAVTVTSCLSMALIFGMCVLTGITKGDTKWYIIGALFLLFAFYIVNKHIKKLKIYKDANSKGTKKYDFREEYMSIFPADLPEEMPASQLAKILAPMQGRQKKDLYNNAIRGLVSSLNAKNNPNDILCKNISLYGTLMTQVKKRYYIKGENDSIVIYDADFMNPRGELVVDTSDVLSFGIYANYPAKINNSGAKISQDSIIIEIQTGESDDDRLYLEAHANDYERIKKLLGGKKER